jgi:hypothetical protein
MAKTVLSVPTTTPLDPNAPIEPINSSPPPGRPPTPTPVPSVTPLNPALRQPPRPTPLPTPGTTGGYPPPRPTPVPGTTSSTEPGQPASPATGITQLPDGAGGVINVPPPGITPPITQPGYPGMTSPLVPPRPTPVPGVGDPSPGGIQTPSTPTPLPGTQQFGPNSNLINTQINPTSDPRLINLQGMQDASLQKVLNGPDRNAQALDQYNTWNAETAPDLEHAFTDATDLAAAHGQIKSGQLTNRYGDLARQRVLDQTTARNKYMQNALDASIGDTQRGFEDVSGAAGTAYNQGVTGREELRGERGYQQSAAEQALQNRINQQKAEAAARAASFGEGATTYGLGNEGDPTGALQGASAQSADEAAAAAGDTGALLRILAQRRGTGSGSSAVAA